MIGLAVTALAALALALVTAEVRGELRRRRRWADVLAEERARRSQAIHLRITEVRRGTPTVVESGRDY